MSLKDRIRRIEERLYPAMKLDGEKLPVPILETIYVEARPDKTGLEEPQHAKVGGQTYHRSPDETFEHFQKRMESLLPPLQPGRFAHEIVCSVSESHR